jgi:ACS family D-galactonate transporter-like MFS transporter
MFGNFAGIVGPWLTGLIVDVTGQFLLAFVAVCIALVVGAASFLFIVGELKPIDWRAQRPISLR